MTSVLTGARRFLVVEDEAMIALLVEDYLSDLGHVMAWQADTIEDALQLVQDQPDIDGALLDMNLHGQPVDPVAAALAERGIPFCFMTGLGIDAATRHPLAPVVGKPFTIGSLRAAIGLLFPSA